MAGAALNGVDVVIVGGGVMGCATAYFLANAGVKVAVVEQHRVGGTPGASGASAAIVEALAGSPTALAQQAQHARRLLDTLARQLREDSGIDIEYQRLGTIRLAFSEYEAQACQGSLQDLYAELDEPTEWLDAATVREAEPAVSPRIRGGLYVPSSNGLYAPRYVRALAAGAAARGALVLEGVSVTGFDLQGDRAAAVRTSEGDLAAGQVLLATGAWTGVVGGWLGKSLPVGPQRGQIVALAPVPGQPAVRHVVHGPGGYAVPKANGTACVGATHENVGFDARITTSGLKFLADLSMRLLPGLEHATVKHIWAGFRPVMLDGDMPAVGRIPGLANVFVAAGHGAVGMTVSASVGFSLAQLLQGQTPDPPLTAFDPVRVLARG